MIVGESVRFQIAHLFASIHTRGVLACKFLMRPVSLVSRKSILQLAIVLLVCGGSSFILWSRIGGLQGGDSVRWLFEASRLSNGEMPYRDFAWMYPPLGLFLVGAAFTVFGATFQTANALLCILGCAVIVLAYMAARLMYPGFTALCVTLSLSLFAATNLGNFALFSLNLYTPALSAGCVGVMLSAYALARSYRSQGKNGWTRASMWSGFAVAALSKPEAALGSLVLLLATVIALEVRLHAGESTRDRVCRIAFGIGIAFVVPTIAYSYLGSVVGWNRLLQGITGYSVGAGFCPWWPTGQGIAGALAAMGLGIGVACAVALARRQIPTHRRWIAFGCMFAGVAAWIAYLPANVANFQSSGVAGVGIVAIVGFSVSFNGVMLPVQWTGAALVPVLVRGIAVRFRSAAKGMRREYVTLSLVMASLAISSRGLFNHLYGDSPIVSPASYAVLLVVAPSIAVRLNQVISGRAGTSRSVRSVLLTVSVLLLFIGCGRAAWVVRSMVKESVDRLVTPAGAVYVSDNGVSRSLVAAVSANLTKNDTLLEMPWGGGMNFCLRVPSPVYSTQMWGLRPDETILVEDLERIRLRPPELIVAKDAPHYGAIYGVPGTFGCCFPRLSWTSGIRTSDDRLFPMVTWVEQSYEPVERVGTLLLLRERRR